MNQREIIVKYIHEHGCITSQDAFRLGITQLGTRIYELKDQGYIFGKRRVKTKNQYGKPTHYDEYMILKEG